MKHSSTRILSMILAVLMLTVMFAGCSPKQAAAPAASADASAPADTAAPAKDTAAEPVTIRFAHGWAASGDTAVGAEFISKFKDDHPEIDLVEEIVAGDEMITKIKVDMASNNLPDAWMYWGSMADVGDYMKAGVLADVDDYFAASAQTDRSDYPEAMFDSFRYNGKAYGIPTESYVGFWFCNKDLFDQYGLEIPETYEDLLACAEVFNANGIVPLAMGSKGGNPSHFFMSELAYQYAGCKDDFAALTNDYQLDSPDFRKVIDLICEMRDRHVFPSDTMANGDWGPSFALYNEGKAAMIYTMTWQLKALSPEIEAKTVQINAPRLPGGTVDPATFVSSNSTYGLVINASSFADPAKRDALVALADLFTSDEWVTEMFYKTGTPNAKSVELDPSKAEVPILLDVLNSAEGKDKMSCHWLASASGEAFYYMCDRLDELFAGALDADTFIEKCQAEYTLAKEEG